MKKIIFIILFILMPCLSSFSDETLKDADKTYQEARTIALSGDIKTAADMFKKVIEMDPNHPSAHRALANCYRIFGSGDAAIKELKLAVSLSPKEYSYRLDLGHLFIEQQKWKEAIEQLDILWDLDFDIAKQLEGDIVMTRGQGLTIESIDKDGTATLGLRKKGYYNEGEIKAGKLYSQGLEYLQNNLNDKAENTFKEAYKLDPSKNFYTLHLARLYSDKQDYTRAATILESSLSQYPEDPQILHMLGAVYLALNKEDDAVKTWIKIKNIDKIIYLTREKWIKTLKDKNHNNSIQRTFSAAGNGVKSR